MSTKDSRQRSWLMSWDLGSCQSFATGDTLGDCSRLPPQCGSVQNKDWSKTDLWAVFQLFDTVTKQTWHSYVLFGDISVLVWKLRFRDGQQVGFNFVLNQNVKRCAMGLAGRSGRVSYSLLQSLVHCFGSLSSLAIVLYAFILLCLCC